MRIAIVDDHAVVRETMASLLEADGHEVIACFGELAPAVELARRRQADAVVVDMVLPGQDVVRGITVLSGLGVRVVAMSGDDSTEPRARMAGAHGWLSKSAPSRELLALLGCPTAPAPAAVEFPRATRPAVVHALAPGSRCVLLTPRERDVLIELAEGHATAQVATRLALRESTVRSYVQSILNKLGVRSRIAAVSIAVDEGLIAQAARATA